MKRIAIDLGQGVYLPGLVRAEHGESVDFYQGQALRNWVGRDRALTVEFLPADVTRVLFREWERLETWAMYDQRDGRSAIDY
ncbi:hypothetical protein [Streptomyces sp. NPDC005955]|uniref:hypothetical protein n=1 Tax=Streptomyces sp. NPDC005955 TaxID=3364738 RepID=UPI0036871C64